ncbi:transcriptional regulator [Limosilactobacillus vaginalis]|uniref:transcriptional regulator n=1 Tax=Limosilactobacillus vaginalis TaxID=1633 RepID=UPI0025A39744|nr:transcriptional regulator [Limosilactobacillus vaginalis]MDM8222224.1 transcriptional regulator [Limosilactobacillus vaginalis]MDM8264771.1 transcriptional regulator [Limosilactobacillus vaginalis]
MKNISKQYGFDYAKDILTDPNQVVLIFWLGFRAFDEDELVVLTENSKESIDSALQHLREIDVINPIKDDQQKWSLTNDGDDLRSILLSLSVWGRQQLDDREEITQQLIVEPDRAADMKELLKFRDNVVRKYINI